MKGSDASNGGSMFVKRLVAFAFALLLGTQAAAKCRPPEIAFGLDAKGVPSAEWLDSIRDRVDAAKLAQIRNSARPLTEEENGWASLVRSEAAAICTRFAQVNRAFRSVAPPRRVRLLLGNQAGDDAFTAKGNRIVIDLAVFTEAYGPSTGQSGLVRRILSHEYSHLLLVPYLARRGWSEESAGRDPFLRAIRTLYNEGIANLQSIQDPKWVDSDGRPTQAAVDSVAALEPVMLERLEALQANPSADEAARLLKNISQGPFTRKWGALPIAVWLQAETGGAPEGIAEWVERGPEGILALAVHNAPPADRARFQTLLTQVSLHAAGGKHGRGEGGRRPEADS